MKNVLLSLCLLLLSAPRAADAAFYQWTDTNGVVHFTDDRKKIPKQYHDKAKRIEVREAPAAESAPPREAAPAPAAKEAAPEQRAPGGHDEQWWRERMGELKGELKTLQDQRAGKEQQMVELRRKRTIFQRARDREAVNAMQASIAADEARISDLLNRIAALELAGARAGVPAEWLQ